MIIEYKRYVHMNIIDTQTTILSPNSSNIFFFLFLGAVEDNSNPVPLWQKMTWTELSPQSHMIMWPSLLLDTLCGLQVLLDVFNYLTIFSKQRPFTSSWTPSAHFFFCNQILKSFQQNSTTIITRIFFLRIDFK